MSADWVNDINRMQTKYGVREWINHATPFQLKKYLEFRLDFIKEEYDETKEALIMEDAEEVVDGLIDLCVVAIGTLDAMGVNVHKAWDEVLTANMAKEVGVKESRPNPLGQMQFRNELRKRMLQEQNQQVKIQRLILNGHQMLKSV